MALSGFLFLAFRVFEFVVLIPILGMLAYFVHLYVTANALTPTYILVLFIASVLGAAWVLATIVTYLRARHSAIFVALVDLAFVGTFIAGVVLLDWITKYNCVNYTGGINASGDTLTINGGTISANKQCTMLKASFALGIIACILFFVTFLLALLVARHHNREDRVVVKREYHTSRHSHRRSNSGRGSRDYARPAHRTSQRSSSRRNYYV